MSSLYVWIAQCLLCVIFGFAGGFKTFGQESEVISKIKCFEKGKLWAGWHRFVGRVEVLGALGVILPAATGILPFLTPLAALGFAAIMVLAIFTVNLPAGRASNVITDVVILAASIVVINGYWDLLRPFPG